MLMMTQDIFKPTQDSFLTQEWQGNPDIFKVKVTGERVSHVYYKLVIFYRVFTKLQVAFYRF